MATKADVKSRTRDKSLRGSRSWSRPDPSGLPLEFSLGTSMLEEFVLSHDFADTLRELVQNEYDAEGTRLRVAFGEDAVTVTGNGKTIDSAGWKRLSVVLGTGQVTGSDRQIAPKANGIGSKNFGLRTLFLYGDQIFVRSDGRQTVLDHLRGTVPKPLAERGSKGRQGVQIVVPFRIKKVGKMEPFTVHREERALAGFADHIMPTLVKLAHPGSPRSLHDLVVTSERCHRRIVWRQAVKEVPCSVVGIAAFERSIEMTDATRSEPPSRRRRTLQETEFQKSYVVPPEYRQRQIPGYFRVPGGRIRLGLSFRMRKGAIDLSQPGIFYYPLALSHGYTGTAVSVNAPFELNEDRSQILDLDNSPWNEWLLERAAHLTAELLVSDWIERFGGDAYLALKRLGEAKVPLYVDRVSNHLRNEECWPTRAQRPRSRGKPAFARTSKVVIPAADDLDGFLSDNRYLDTSLGNDSLVRDMAVQCGADRFTVNSLVRLRCAGKDSSGLATEPTDGEANWHYINYSTSLKDEALQVRFSQALDAHSRQLSPSNKQDLRNTPSTLRTDGGLGAPATPLWVVDENVASVCPVPDGQRLHKSLMTSSVIRRLCTGFDARNWARQAAKKAKEGEVKEYEKLALYRYVLSTHGDLGRQTLAVLRTCPILLDYDRQWVCPRSITLRRARGARRLGAALHFPHRDFAKDTELARAFRFRDRIDGDDLVRYAQMVENDHSLAERFEETLDMFRELLTSKVVSELAGVSFLRSSTGGTSTPPSLYLRNALNVAALGNEAPFVSGSRVKLYKRLGCMSVPRACHIIDNLSQLRETGSPPERPEKTPSIPPSIRASRM